MPESSCTVYKSNKSGGFDRYYIPSCHWQENKASNVLKSGTQNADSVTVYIPLDSLFDIQYSAAKDIIVKGNCSFRFDNSSQQSISASLKVLRDMCTCYTIMSIDKKTYGRKQLQHIKISAR